MKYKLSICLPAHRTHLWENFYNSIVSSVGDYSWELIMVGPYDPPPFFSDKKNFKFFKDFGSPARCAQISTLLAEGEIMAFSSDDAIYTPNSLSSCIEKLDSLGKKDAIALRYTEGRDHQGAPMHHNYWMAHHHPTLRVVPAHYKILMIGMMRLDYYRELGGLDCDFEHLNMNTHDLSFRLQNDGGTIHESDSCVHTLDWNPGVGDHIPVQQAYDLNDLSLFQKIYHPNNVRQNKIDYFNWVNSPKVWKRRFGDI